MRIHPSTIIHPNVTFEDIDSIHIGPFCVIGGLPEDKKFFDKEPPFGVHIKKGARISEMVTIHAGTIRTTTIGVRSCIFAHSHVAHDVIIENDCIIGGSVSLAGHTHLMPFANVSGRVGTVPYTVIGAHAFVGASSLVSKHVPPGEKHIGFPARFTEYNDVGLSRAGMTLELCNIKYKDDYKILIKGKDL